MSGSESDLNVVKVRRGQLVCSLYLNVGSSIESRERAA